jgi:metal-sulfur cluster biosynthetic enzyme
LASVLRRACLTRACLALAALVAETVAVAAEVPAARPAETAPAADAPPSARVDERNDPLDVKLRLLEEAWHSQDYELARSLASSLRTTIVQAQDAEAPAAPSAVPAAEFARTDALPGAWQSWARGWRFFKVLNLTETAGVARRGEPCEIVLSFPADQVDSLRRELRLARLVDGTLQEVPSQVYREVRRGDERSAHVLWMADVEAGGVSPYLAFYGNPDAELPDYPSDLTASGEGVGLQIENAAFKALLSPRTGQLERLTLKREHGLELFSGGEGHGEPAGIDWAHDYVDADGFQKYRVSLWDQCPDYEVVRGPLCTIVRRWGFPYSPVHPLFAPSRLHVAVEYRFYAGLPWFHKIGAMRAVQDFEASALRDDEWVFSGYSFSDTAWIDRDGRFHSGPVDPGQENDLWGVGFFNPTSRDAFFALFLEHRGEGIAELVHGGAPTLHYRWHGNLWSRYPLPGRRLARGAVLRQKNAYVAIPFTPEEGPAAVERLRRQLVRPLQPAGGRLESPAQAAAPAGRLARPGEAQDSPIPKRLVWDALGDCKDAQLYTADASVVDLGLIYDVRVRGAAVTVVMAMPHRGRPLAGYFVHGSVSVHPEFSLPIRERLLQVPGVRQVVVQQTWEPAWNVNMVTDEGRRKLGL